MTQFYLKIEVPNLKILQYFCYFLRLYNHQQKKNPQNSRVNLEILENGFLFIYDDVKTFEEIVNLRNIDVNSSKIVILSKLNRFPEKFFPQSGIDIMMHLLSAGDRDFFPMLEVFYSSIHPDFSFQKSTKTQFLLHCPNYQAFYAFLIDFMARYSKFM
ncbi:MAG: hypothetical protein ACTSRK_16105 [Promethearchaeota archaeon]